MIVYRELASVEKDLGIPAKTLYALSNNIAAHYHPVSLPKKDGGTRQLYVPDQALKQVQRAIAEKLLPLEPVSAYATAYRPGTSILANARPHVGKETLLKLDIYRFFDNIRYSAVKEKAFPAARYSESIRILLSMLCYYKDILPQGAPTSPAISNIILYDFDNAVAAWCEARNIAYTRYCDDMTFSGSFDKAELIAFVSDQLQRQGFLLNRRKTKTATPGRRQQVTGVVVNEKPNVSDAYKRQIRQEVYYLQKYGVTDHLKHSGNTATPQAYLAALYGKINFILQITPTDKHFQAYKKIVASLIISV